MKTRTVTKAKTIRPLLAMGRERLSLWRKAFGLWKNRHPDPLKELAVIRRGWNRKFLPSK